VVHRIAPLSETGRLRLARCVIDEDWPLRRTAERFQVSPITAARYRDLGVAGMRRARQCPAQDLAHPPQAPLPPWRAGHIAQAIHVLHTREIDGVKGAQCRLTHRGLTLEFSDSASEVRHACSGGDRIRLKVRLLLC
jgi:hypothetical protein